MKKILRSIGMAFIVYLSISFIGACFEWALFIFGKTFLYELIYSFGISIGLPDLMGEYITPKSIPWVEDIETFIVFGIPLIGSLIYLIVSLRRKSLLILLCLFALPISAKEPIKAIPKGGRYAILVDFSKPSGEDRFKIYDCKSHCIIYSSVVQHGNGGGSTKEKPVFSNRIGSNCSSLGLYKITGFGRMNSFPINCFRLKGLSSTNSNAEKRGIVIHPTLSSSLPFKTHYLPLTDESHGCFGVSFETMRVIRKLYGKGIIYLYAFH